MRRYGLLGFVLCGLATWCVDGLSGEKTPTSEKAPSSEKTGATAEPKGLRLVVMDPLALELSCPCVQGYAQRDYKQLAKYLQERLGVPVDVSFSESLVKALKDDERAEIVIGKRSVVEYDAKRSRRGFNYAASLTGKDGKTTQYGMIVVRTADKATSAADLKGYRIYFGPEESAEKHGAAVVLLRQHGIELPAKLETVAGCEEGATAILEMGPEEKGAAVISSYARPLLEGCGTVPKGAIRVVAETKPVPFVTAFVSDKLSGERQKEITAALLELVAQAELMAALETKRGFVKDDVVAQADGAVPARSTVQVGANVDVSAPVEVGATVKVGASAESKKK
jgi:ABC-type phosphate/phosphonate transport system substrate-binding protein